MIKNNVELTHKAAEVLHRFEHGEIDVKTAKTMSSLISNIQKGYVIDMMKQKEEIELLASEEERGTSGKMHVKRVS
jgi:hypothetical protein